MGNSLGPSFATFQPTNTVSPPTDSWTSYPAPYEIGSQYSLLSPTGSPYGTSFSSQYSPYVHDSTLFSARHQYDYGSPPRPSGHVVSGGELDDKVVNHAPGGNSGDHYAHMDDKFDNNCGGPDG